MTILKLYANNLQQPENAIFQAAREDSQCRA